jgi:KUP system potassium uptake protein
MASNGQRQWNIQSASQAQRSLVLSGGSSDVTYFIGRETVVPREDGKGLPRLVQGIFTFLLRNSGEALEYFHLPRIWLLK